MRALLLGVTLAACAPSTGQGPTTNNAATAGNDSNLVCREETPTGSSISRKVCRTPEQMEEDRKAAEDMFRNQNSRPDRLGRPSN